jgi:hypothetical protein
LTLYGGLGYNVANSSMKMLGQYDINGDGNFNGTRETNPVDVSFAASGPRVTGGFRLKLAVITLHADYTEIQRDHCGIWNQREVEIHFRAGSIL